MLQQKPSLIGFSIQHPHQFFPRKSRLPMMLPNDAAQIRFPYCWSLAGSIALQRPTAEVAEPLVVTNVYIVFAPWIWIYQFLAACAICLFICPFRSSSTFAVWLYASGHEITRLGWHTSSPAPGIRYSLVALSFLMYFRASWTHVSMGMGLAHGELWGSPHSGQAMIFKWMFQEITVDHNRLDMSRFRCVFSLFMSQNIMPCCAKGRHQLYGCIWAGHDLTWPDKLGCQLLSAFQCYFNHLQLILCRLQNQADHSTTQTWNISNLCPQNHVLAAADTSLLSHLFQWRPLLTFVLIMVFGIYGGVPQLQTGLPWIW